jgi:hypothetical protein
VIEDLWPSGSQEAGLMDCKKTLKDGGPDRTKKKAEHKEYSFVVSQIMESPEIILD